MNKLFQAYGNEERTDKVSVELNIENVIGMEDAEHDVQIAAEQINTGIDMMANGMEVASNIETQIAVEEAIVSGSEVTPGIAQLSMVSLQSNAKLLGMDADAYSVSNESIEQNPTAALKVSTEAAKETFDKIIKQVKEFFSKMWSKLKKMYGKILLMVTDYEKKFEKLKDRLAELSSDVKDGVKDEFTDSEAKKIINKFYALVALNGSFDATELKYNPTVAIAESITKVIGEDKVEDAIKSAAAKATEYNDLYDGLPSSKEDTQAVVISRIDGTTVKAITFSTDEVELRTGKMVKVTTTYLSGSAKKDIITKAAKKVAILKHDAITSVIAEGTKLAKGAKDFVKDVDGILDNVDKSIKGLKVDAKGTEKDKEADEKKIESVYGSMAGSVSTNSLKFASDSLLGYVGTMKNLAYLANVSMSKYKAKESK